MAGVRSIRIHDEDVPVAADVRNIDTLSAHADSDEIMMWLTSGKTVPQRTFITHGEPEA